MKKVAFIFLIVFCASAVYAQSAGDLGLVYRIDPSPSIWIEPGPRTGGTSIFNIDKFHGIGFIYHFSDTAAVNPVLTLALAKFKTEEKPDGGSFDDTAEDSVLVFGIETTFPLYVKQAQNVSIFLAPGLRLTAFSAKWEDKTETWPNEKYRFMSLGALFNVGAQASFGNFAVFSSWGLGLDYVSLRGEEEDEGERRIKGPALSTNQVNIGLIYYIN